MLTLEETIEFIEAEVALAHNDDVPETAKALEAALCYLIRLEAIYDEPFL